MRAALTPTVTAPNVCHPRIQAAPLCQLWQVFGPKGIHIVAGQFNFAGHAPALTLQCPTWCTAQRKPRMRAHAIAVRTV